MAKLGENKGKMEQTSFYISLSDKIELEKLAEKLNTTQSNIIRDAIHRYISYNTRTRGKK